MNTKPIIPIFFTIDESYAPWLSVALLTMKENASKTYQYDVHVVYHEMSEDTIGRLSAIADDDFSIQFTPMPETLSQIGEWKSANKLRADYFTLTIFIRLFLPDLFPQYDKAIYLDSDICVPGDISKMYEIDLGDNYLGVINDYSIAGVPDLVRYVEDAIGVDHTRYFNSGILLMNFREMREHHLTERFLDLMARYHFDTIAPDQDYLNAMCKDKVVYLDRVWDSMPCELPEFTDPQIIHYNLFDKPWCYDNVKYEKYFWDAARRSNFYDEIVEYKNSYSSEQKEKDKESQTALIMNANKILDEPVTMKTVFESGQEARL